MNEKKYLPYLAGLILALIFGFSFLFTNEALQIYTTFELLSYRFLLAAVVITVLAAFKIIKLNYKGKPVRMLILIAFFQPICYFTCETLGIKFASVSEVGIFVAFIPVFVTILAFFILKEKPGGRQAVFILMSVSGALLNVIMSGTADYSGNVSGIVFLVGLVLAAGGYNILTRVATKTFSPMEVTFFMMWAGAILFTLMRIIESKTLGIELSFSLHFSLWGILPILYLGILSSIVAFFLLNYILSALSVASASVFVQLASVVAIMSGLLILREALYWYHIISGILILIGVFGTNYYEDKGKK